MPKSPSSRLNSKKATYTGWKSPTCTTAAWLARTPSRAIEAVEGVKANTVKNKQVSFVVEGDFSPAELVKALQKAGFYPTLKGKEDKKLKVAFLT